MVKQITSDTIDNKVFIPPQGESPASPKSILAVVGVCDELISVQVKLLTRK